MEYSDSCIPNQVMGIRNQQCLVGSGYDIQENLPNPNNLIATPNNIRMPWGEFSYYSRLGPLASKILVWVLAGGAIGLNKINFLLQLQSLAIKQLGKF